MVLRFNDQSNRAAAGNLGLVKTLDRPLGLTGVSDDCRVAVYVTFRMPEDLQVAD